MSKRAIEVSHLSKRYEIGGIQKHYDSFREALTNSLTAPFIRAKNLISGKTQSAANLQETIWALKDISFEVREGEVLGIIGRNGAGKSTLLKILSQITDPSEGEARIYGRLGALLEVGTGFHAELTGRENVYLNGSILGMSRREIERKFDEIVAFSGVEKFIDTPVKHYSSGMTVRLAFAVAAHLEPEILVIDEVLSVGDAAFQKKSMGKMNDVASSGRTVLFVSHNMAAVEALCDRVILLEQGTIKAIGDPLEIIGKYLGSISQSTEDYQDLRDIERTGKKKFTFTRMKIAHQTTGEKSIRTGDPVEIRLQITTADQQPAQNVAMTVTFHTIFGQPLFSCSHRFSEKIESLDSTQTVIFEIPKFPLLPGSYSISLMGASQNERDDIIQNAMQFDVIEGDFFGHGRLMDSTKAQRLGTVAIEHSWSLESQDTTIQTGDSPWHQG